MPFQQPQFSKGAGSCGTSPSASSCAKSATNAPESHEPARTLPPRRCVLCLCTAVDIAHGFPVCDYHRTRGESDPVCPACQPDDPRPLQISESAARETERIKGFWRSLSKPGADEPAGLSAEEYDLLRRAARCKDDEPAFWLEGADRRVAVRLIEEELLELQRGERGRACRATRLGRQLLERAGQAFREQAELQGRDHCDARVVGLTLAHERVGDLVLTGPVRTREQLATFLAACVEEVDRRGRRVEHLGPLHVARQTSTAAALHVIALTGLRSGAIGDALEANLDEQRRTLKVWTKGHSRVVGLSQVVLDLLVARRRLVKGRHDYLFPGYLRRGVSSVVLNTAFKRLRDAAGLPRNHHENDLRHTAITNLRLSGATKDQAREFAGHRYLSTTEIYDHSEGTPTELALADRLAAFVGVHHG